jgi:RNA polymerase sigma factor (sigma-70 family)
MSKLTIKKYEQYIGLILYCCARHVKTPICSHYDMLQAGTVGLAEALSKYDKSKGVPEKYWVYRFINSAIIKARYKSNKERKEDNVDFNFFEGYEGAELSPLDNLLETEDEQIKQDRLNQIMSILRRITSSEPVNRSIYLDRMLRGMTYKDIGKKHNLTAVAVSHRIYDMSDKIKEALLL